MAVSTTELPSLLDCKRLRQELGITRAAAERLMSQLPIVKIDGLRKLYVRRADVAAHLEKNTHPPVCRHPRS